MFNGYTWQTRTLEVRPDRMGEDVALAGAGYGLVGMGGVPLAAAAAAAAGALGGVGVYATQLAGSISPAPVHASAALSANGAGTPAGGAKLAAPAPSLGGANGRFAGLTPFGTLEEDGSRPGTSSAQVTRNLFVGNVSAFFVGCSSYMKLMVCALCSCRSTYSGKTSRTCSDKRARFSVQMLR